jgi:hypothetical protein
MQRTGCPILAKQRVGRPEAYELLAAFTHERILTAYTPIQNRFAGINPSCPVRMPMMHTITLLTPATTNPVHLFWPTRIVERTVSKQEK